MYGGTQEGIRYAGNIPAVVALAEEDPDIYPEELRLGQAYRRCAAAQKRTVYFGSDFGDPSEMSQIMQAAADNVRTGAMAAEEALAEAQAALEEALVRWDEA